MDDRCKRAFQRLHLLLDRELSQQEIAEVEYHLGACPPCRQVFIFEASIKRLVHDRVIHESCPDSVKARLLSSLPRRQS